MPIRSLAAAAATAAFTLLSAPAHAVGAQIDVRIVDRSTGATLPMYWHDGRWWVAGRPGNRYAVSLVNRSEGRLLTVLSVDGVNVISGETAAHDQTGYVLSPGQSAQITGWRKDMSRVAAFEFTALSRSYAARTGRPDHVGVIGVALFQEKPRPRPLPPPISHSREEAVRDAAREMERPSAPQAGAADSAAAPAESARRSEGRMAQERLGTGHGRNEHSPTSRTAFERAQAYPNETITIYYDSQENLIAMGVIPAPRHLPNPFPAAAGFVPDPPRP
jgi:hypothetical protein